MLGGGRYLDPQNTICKVERQIFTYIEFNSIPYCFDIKLCLEIFNISNDFISKYIIFSNNFITKITKNLFLQCMGQLWYVQVDFQIFLVMPFLILPAKLLKRSELHSYFGTCACNKVMKLKKLI